MSVDFTDVVVSQHAIAGCRAILNQRGDFSILVDEADMPGAVFVHRDCTLKWPGDKQNSRQLTFKM